ncbi:hypothetical protein GCM10028796_14680 [Ramlibacter monticola]
MLCIVARGCAARHPGRTGVCLWGDKKKGGPWPPFRVPAFAGDDVTCRAGTPPLTR